MHGVEQAKKNFNMETSKYMYVTLSGENITLSGENNLTWNKGNKWKKILTLQNNSRGISKPVN